MFKNSLQNSFIEFCHNNKFEINNKQIEIVKSLEDFLNINGNGNILLQKENDNIKYNFSKSKKNLKFDTFLDKVICYVDTNR